MHHAPEQGCERIQYYRSYAAKHNEYHEEFKKIGDRKAHETGIRGGYFLLGKKSCLLLRELGRTGKYGTEVDALLRSRRIFIAGGWQQRTQCTCERVAGRIAEEPYTHQQGSKPSRRQFGHQR